jgi:pimeloyl-ACP methyl ester carboxylesterase
MPATTPTVVLVHGAFADASSWSGVIAELQAAGVAVAAPPNPLRNVPEDGAFLTAFVDQLDAPVVLAGHSYAGALITQTGTDARQAVGLVYVAAFSPESGETLNDINGRYAAPPLSSALRTYACAGGSEAYIDPAQFPNVFCADVPADRARVLAVSQRSASSAAFSTAITGAPGWRRLPSWAVVATRDQAINPDAERDMAKRAGSETVELDGSHAVAVSQPIAVADVILRAVKATS